jgi:hypothetical protein
MDISKDLEAAETLLRQWALQIEPCPSGRLDVVLAPCDLPAAVHILCGTEWGRLQKIGLRTAGAGATHCELVYDFRHAASQVCLRVPLPEDGGCIPSVAHICTIAATFEIQLAQRGLVRFCDESFRR